MRRGMFAVLGLVVGGLGGVGAARAQPAPTPPAPSAASATPTAPPTPIVVTPVADTFDQLVRFATKLRAPDVDGLVWALTSACDEGDDLARRQCRWVRDARVAGLQGQTFVVAVDASAVTMSTWDPSTQTVRVDLRGCVSCGRADKVALAAGRGAAAIVDGAVRGAVLHTATRAFSSDAAATRWRSEVLPRLEIRLAVRVSPSPRWTDASVAGVTGLSVDVVGFRVHDPCSGLVIASSPPSGRVAGDAGRCGKTVTAVPDKERPRVPAQLSSADIRAAMAPAQAAARACFDRYGVAGEAVLRIGIDDAGAVIAFSQAGAFADTPTGACIEQAVRAVVFPRTQRTRTSITYPIVLR